MNTKLVKIPEFIECPVYRLNVSSGRHEYEETQDTVLVEIPSVVLEPGLFAVAHPDGEHFRFDALACSETLKETQ